MIDHDEIRRKFKEILESYQKSDFQGWLTEYRREKKIKYQFKKMLEEKATQQVGSVFPVSTMGEKSYDQDSNSPINIAA